MLRSMVGFPQPSGFQRSESNACALNNKLSFLFGVISLIVGRLVWRNVWTRISEVLMEKIILCFTLITLGVPDMLHV
jgi:hypothetical protein